MKGEFKYAKIYKLFIARNVIAIKYKLIFGNYLLRAVDNCYLTQTTPAYYLTFII